MILAHHGWGEELIVYSVLGSGAVPALVLLWRARVTRLARVVGRGLGRASARDRRR